MTEIQNNKVTGSMGLENKLSQNAEKLNYDETGKSVLKHKEILANILKYSVPEYETFSMEEIMSFIDADSIMDQEAIAPDTDTRIDGDDAVQSSINEANLTFDVFFKVISPQQENQEKKNIHLHVDVELQGDYYPGYPIEKRGIYNLARMTSSQLAVVTKKTNYNILEKSYCIFICVGNVPQYLWNTVSYYGIANTKNIGNVEINPKNYDLMGLVVIRIGERTMKGVAEIIRFLHALFFNTEEIEDYIDFSQNEQFRKELTNMGITGEHLIQLGEHRQLEKVKEAEKQMAEAKKEAAEAKKEAAEAKREVAEAYKRIEELEKRMNEMRK